MYTKTGRLHKKNGKTWNNGKILILIKRKKKINSDWKVLIRWILQGSLIHLLTGFNNRSSVYPNPTMTKPPELFTCRQTSLSRYPLYATPLRLRVSLVALTVTCTTGITFWSNHLSDINYIEGIVVSPQPLQGQRKNRRLTYRVPSVTLRRLLLSLYICCWSCVCSRISQVNTWILYSPEQQAAMRALSLCLRCFTVTPWLGHNYKAFFFFFLLPSGSRRKSEGGGERNTHTHTHILSFPGWPAGIRSLVCIVLLIKYKER